MKLYSGILLSLSLLTINKYCWGMFGGYSEFRKEQFAMRSREQRENGFEGCKNKQECGFEGFYLAKYSPEGLCDDCEFKQYPQRFVACLFCRQPMPKIFKASVSCLMCEAPAQKLLEKKLQTSDDWLKNHALRSGIIRCFHNARNTVGRKPITALKDLRVVMEIFERKCKGPRIYRGVMKKGDGTNMHVWVDDIAIATEDAKEITEQESEGYVRFICEKYNIFGPETGAVISGKMPENIVATYEEKVIDHK